MSNIGQKTYEASTPHKVAFLGLGVMGYPMAGHLTRAGHQVTVYNRSAAKAQAWLAECPGHASAPTPREAAAGADIVFACVGNDADLRSVVLGPDGAFAGMKPGAIFVDHTTASAEVARELYGQAQKLGLHFVDAPVSGGQGGAHRRQRGDLRGVHAGAFGADGSTQAVAGVLGTGIAATIIPDINPEVFFAHPNGCRNGANEVSKDNE